MPDRIKNKLAKRADKKRQVKDSRGAYNPETNTVNVLNKDGSGYKMKMRKFTKQAVEQGSKIVSHPKRTTRDVGGKSVQADVVQFNSALPMKTPMNMKSPMESNRFIGEKIKAEKAGKDSFVVDGKSYPLTMKGSPMEVRGANLNVPGEQMEYIDKSEGAPTKMKKSPYTMYGQEMSPAQMQGKSPLAKYGISKRLLPCQIVTGKHFLTIHCVR